MSKKSHKALASATVMSLILTSTLTAVPVSAAATVERLEGAGREETAISVAKKAFADGAETVVLVNGYGYGDAVSATPLAKALNAPILLTNKVDVPSADLLNALSSLKAKKVVIVGGEGVVTTALANKLAETYTVERIGGASRYETNAGVAKKVLELTGKKEAFLVNGQDGYADALSVASIAASKGAPVLFGNKNEVPSVVKNVAEGLTVSAVGGAGVLPTSVIDSVKGTRVAEGKDRFATNLEVLKKFKDDLKLDSIYMAFGGATPTQFADALVASAAAAKVGAPVVLSGSKNSDASTSAAKDYIKENHKDNTKIYLVGGTGSLDSAIESSIKDMVNPVVTEFKVDEVKSENLKDFEVKFTQKLDKKTAEDKENYTLSNGKEINKAVLLDDGMTVRVSAKDSLKNQEEYKLSIKNVRNEAKDKKIDVKDFKFKPIDAALPEVAKIEALGNKAVKITFSEPIKKSSVTVDSFRIDDKYISGNVEADDSRTVIVKSYTKLSDGEHTLTIKGLKDFADYTMITKDVKFNVVEDKTAPVVAEVTATFEKVRVKFSEPVQNVRAGSYAYWTMPSSKTKNLSTSVEKIEDDTYEFTFTGNAKLPPYGVEFYLVGVKDYSDNEIEKDKPVLVTANIDEIRPEVTSVEVDKDTNKEIKIKFSKTIKNIKELKNYSLKDKDGKTVSIYQVEPSDNDKTATIKFYNKLKEGEYTLKLEGLRDNTTLENVMLPYEEVITVKDNAAPAVESISVEDRRITVKFDKTMSVEGKGSIGSVDNYFIEYKGNTIKLPEGTSIQVSGGAKSVLIILPDEINSKEYKRADLTKLFIQSVEDAHGNILESQSRTQDISTGSENLADFTVAKDKDDATKDKAKLKDSKTIEIEFTQEVGTVGTNNFVIKVGDDDKTVSSVDVDYDKVILNLKDDVYTTEGLSLTINNEKEDFKSASGQLVSFDRAVKLSDKVNPELKLAEDDYELKVEGKDIIVPFNKNIENDPSLAYAFKVISLSDKKTLGYNDYAVKADGKNVIITIKKELEEDTAFTVELVNGLLVKDHAENTAETFDPYTTAIMKK